MKNKNPGYILLTIIFVALSYQINAQSIERQSISSYGSSATIDGITIQQTVGQPYNTDAYTDSNISIRPGFQQSVLLTAFLSNTLENTFIFSVYPNPVINSFNISIPEEINARIVQITDITGKVILDQEINRSEGDKISCNNWPDGLYFITITAENNSSYTSKFIIKK